MAIVTISIVIISSFCCSESHKLPFYESSITSYVPLELIYSDVWTSLILSFDGYKYYVIFVDHFTKYIWLYLLKHKSDVFATFIAFKALAEHFFKAKITILYSDNKAEYIALRHFLITHGITHLTTPSHTPENNGASNIGIVTFFTPILPYFIKLPCLFPCYQPKKNSWIIPETYFYFGYLVVAATLG